MTEDQRVEMKQWAIIGGFLLVVMVVVGLIGGCSSARPVKQAIDEAYAAGFEAGSASGSGCGILEEALRATSEELAAAQKRLRKFNQVDTKGALRPLKQKAGEILGQVAFRTDSAELSEVALEVLDQVVDYLVLHPELVVRVDGFADERGSDLYNQELGMRRATAVMAWLIDHGARTAQVWANSLGEYQQVCQDSTPDCWALNRRAVLEVHEE